MSSMLAGVQEFLTPSFLSHVSDETGESEAAVSKGFTAVVPALLGLIANRSSDTGFMSRLVSLAGNAASDPDILARSSKALRSDDTSIDSGTGIGAWLSGLLPGGSGGLSAMTSSLSRFAGVRASTASSMLSIAGPLVLGYIGRMMRSDNLDGPKLAKRLEAERGTFAAALPAGFNPFASAGDVIRTDRRDSVPHARRSAAWLWPLALIALAVLGLFWWNARDRTPAVNTAVGVPAATVRMLTRSLPGNIQLNVPAGSMEDRLIGYLSAPTGAGAFDFDRIEFETGSTSLRPQSRAQLANIGRILSAYPQARVSIDGHTDNTGNEAENVALSQGRAEAVMNALRENGAPAANLTARGLGSQSPVADNSTEAGRARNRRVTLSVAS